MKVKIYTYSDPYRIDEESYWDEIKECPQFCVSQTMVNGMNSVYPHYKKNHQLATIKKLVNSLYSEWESQNIKVKQMIEVDNAISKIEFNSISETNIKRSLQYNTKQLVNCIRIFSELGLKYRDFEQKNITSDQIYLLNIFKIIEESDKSTFKFTRIENNNDIDEAIKNALKTKGSDYDISSIDTGTVIIHGIHQFSPSILCAIEDLAKFKNIILLFNYQSQYKEVYKTWMNIYSLFDSQIVTSDENQFIPTSLYYDSYKSNLLADFIGKVSDGHFEELESDLNEIEITEFENVTEFANYCAKIYDSAKNNVGKPGYSKNALANMKEQFYSPSKKVNDILRAYFPEQFGERHFLDYPIGQFFVATMNMWDSDSSEVIVNNFSDLKECLQSGIIVEKNKGELLNTFNNVSAYFEKEKTLKDIIFRLKNLRKYTNSPTGEKSRVGYFLTTKEELSDLIIALEDLDKIIHGFFEDFDSSRDNFKKFYKRVQKFITSKINDMEDLDSEMQEVIEKLLQKLEVCDLPDSGSYLCLKQTMRFYLSQDDAVNYSANWIVRGFEQIDGDILRSANQDATKIKYHFCCLSDKNMCNGVDNKLPWPLDIKFLEYAHIAEDLKYQIYLKSKIEYKNFNRYALLYGLEFNRIGCKLSYIKNENDKENDLYFVLRLLGIKPRKYKLYETSVATVPFHLELPIHQMKFSDLDKYKASICPYRFALETLVQNKTIFRERFLIHHYMRVIMTRNVAKKFEGQMFIDSLVHKEILDEYQAISDKFKLTDELEKTQLIAAVYSDIKKSYLYKGKFKSFSLKNEEYEDLKMDLLLIDLKKIELLSDDDFKKLVESGVFQTKKGAHCIYCASKDVCLEYK